MSRIVALLRWANEPVAANELTPLLDSLRVQPSRAATRGGPWFAVAAYSGVSDRAALADQPADMGSRFVLAFDGRIDNRDELLRRFGNSGSQLEVNCSDAALVLQTLLARGDSALDLLVGPFALLVVDKFERSLRLARDPLGGRSLFFRWVGSTLAVASRPSALARFGGQTAEFEEESIARYLAVDGPRPGGTYFRGVHEVPPGADLSWTAGEQFRTRRLDLLASPPPGKGRDADFAERFRELLDLAVTCRLSESGPSAVLMSGGLDSTAVAATAARALAKRGGDPPITLSWVFDELQGIDERLWIESANRASGAEAIEIMADTLWPLADEPTWPRPADAPVMTPYVRPRERALMLAHERGCRVILNGEAGDDLWWLSTEWLRSLLTSGHIGRAFFELSRLAALLLGGQVSATVGRSAFARLLRPHSYQPRRETWPWLTPWAHDLVSRASRLGRSSSPAPLSDRPQHPMTNAFDLAFLRSGEDEASPFGMEWRRPYRDRRIVEFFLGVPPRLLYRPGQRKLLQRLAFADRLPRVVVERRTPTSLVSLYLRGLADKGRSTILAAINSPDALWPKYVRREWLEPIGLGRLKALGEGSEALVIWHCYCLERWAGAWRQSIAPKLDPR